MSCIYDRYETLLTKSEWYQSRSPRIQQALLERPPWKYYVSKDDPTLPIRHYGIMEMSGGELRAHTYVPLSIGISVILGGRFLDSLVAVGNWNANHMSQFELAGNVHAFVHPRGYRYSLRNNRRLTKNQNTFTPSILDHRV